MTTTSSQPADFVRVLARVDVLALAFGAMIGWGWIVLTGGAIVDGGSVGAMIGFMIGGVAILLIGLTYAELASAMPRVGGEHVYSYRALGHFASFICTWSIVLGYVSVSAFEIVALPTVVEHLFPNYAVGDLWQVAGWDVKASWVAVGAVSAIIMTWVNYVGITTAALVQKVVVGLILVAGALFFAGALTLGDNVNMQPLFNQGDKGTIGGVIAVLAVVPFLFVGFDVIPQAAEEINIPQRDIGKILLLSVAVAVIWYILVVLATSLALDAKTLKTSLLSVPDAMAALFHSIWGSHLMVVAGIAGIITSTNAFFIGGSRAIYALAHSGMLPSFLAKLHPRYKTPTNAVLLIGFLSFLAPFFGKPILLWLVNAGGLGIVVAYLFVTISFLILRYREPDMPRPYRVKCGKIVGFLAVVLSLTLTLLYFPGSPSALTGTEWSIFAIWMLAGLAMYLWARRRYGLECAERIIQKGYVNEAGSVAK